MLLTGQSLASLEHAISALMEAKCLDKSIPWATQKIIDIFVHSETRDPVILIKDMIEKLTHQNNEAGRSSGIFLFCLIAGTFFREYDVAMKLIKFLDHQGTYMAVVNEFFVGLVSLFIAKGSSSEKKS